jgi:hypothetical protein
MAAARMPAAELKLPPKFEPVARLATAAPPEFGSDALLRLLESRKISDGQTALELAQMAFDLASSSHFRISMRATPGVQPDSRQGALAKAYALGLDAISLQSRAVLAMLPLDGVRAREMFQAISMPEMKPLYDQSAVYQAMAAVARGGFTSKERAKEDHVAFVLDAVIRLHLTPTREGVEACGLTPTQTDAVMARVPAVPQDPPGEKEALASASVFWQSEPAKQIMAAAVNLRQGATVDLADLEKNLNAWSAAPEQSETDYYNQKCIVYQALVELIPQGPVRDKTLRSFVEFVIASNLQSQSPVEWFEPAQAMLQRIRNTNNGEPAKVLAAFEASGNPVLVLYAALERVLERPSPWFVTTS